MYKEALQDRALSHFEIVQDYMALVHGIEISIELVSGLLISLSMMKAAGENDKDPAAVIERTFVEMTKTSVAASVLFLKQTLREENPLAGVSMASSWLDAVSDEAIEAELLPQFIKDYLKGIEDKRLFHIEAAYLVQKDFAAIGLRSVGDVELVCGVIQKVIDASAAATDFLIKNNLHTYS